MSKSYADDELRKASNHLFYEIWMMNRLACLLSSGAKAISLSKPVSHTHTIESAVIVQSTGVIKASQNNEKEELRVVNSAIIEAFAILVRSLLDFFYSEARQDDVIAQHFFSSPDDWIKARPSKSSADIYKVKTRVNKEIAHLTYSRQKNFLNLGPSRILWMI